MSPADNYTEADFGPSHRWVVFICAKDGHPRRVGYTPEEYADKACEVCGADLVAVPVAPVEDNR